MADPMGVASRWQQSQVGALVELLLSRENLPVAQRLEQLVGCHKIGWIRAF